MYIPPTHLQAMKHATSLDKSSPDYQQLSWDALRKSIMGIANWVNITNIKANRTRVVFLRTSFMGVVL
jgi:pre-mRNA-splicing factor CWC22